MRFPHELRDEFPGQAPLIERLTKTNYEFGRLAAAYDEVNRHIWRIEFGRRADHGRGARKAEEAAPLAQGRYCSPAHQRAASNVASLGDLRAMARSLLTFKTRRVHRPRGIRAPDADHALSGENPARFGHDRAGASPPLSE